MTLHASKDLTLLCEGTLNFLTLLLDNYLIPTYLSNLKLNLNFMFALFFGTIYMFEYLYLIEIMKHLDVVHHKDIMFRNNMFLDTSIPTHHIFSPIISCLLFKGVNQKCHLLPSQWPILSQQLHKVHCTYAIILNFLN